jgi:AcrR family transcriptional regulator
MVRPRFAKLPPAQQQVILGAALSEFAARGFHEASLNRVIEEAGISKGSMYYYFDGKEDLYAYVTQTELRRLFAGLGPFPVPDVEDADTFWSTMGDYYVRVMAGLTASPQLAALIRGWNSAPTNVTLEEAQRELGRETLPWIERALIAGQRLGAVRSDLPSSLLIAVVVGMGQAMDTWLLTHPADDDDLPTVVGDLIGMIHGAVQPTEKTRPV